MMTSFDNNEDKDYFLKMMLVGHVLDHLLDQIIIGLVTTELHYDFFTFKILQNSVFNTYYTYFPNLYYFSIL